MSFRMFKQKTLRAALFAGAALLAFPSATMAGTETLLWKFGAAGTRSDGAIPAGDLIMDSTGAIYGVTLRGGAGTTGTVFKLMPTGSGLTYSEFILAESSSQYSPSAGFTNLVFSGDRRVYVATASGGLNNAGQILSFSTDGGRTAQQTPYPSYTSVEWDLPSFARAPSSIATAPGGRFFLTNANGVSLIVAPSASPWNWSGGQILAIQNCVGVTVDPGTGDVYGATSSGGANGKGELFKLRWTIGSSPYNYTKTTLYSFTAFDGVPSSRPTLGPNGSLFGVTRNGGSFGAGTVYAVAPGDYGSATYSQPTPTGYGLSTLYTFTSAIEGATPISPPLLDSSGAIYGTTSAGGAYNKGIVYKLEKPLYGGLFSSSRVKTTLYSFGSNASDGVAPTAALIFSGDGGLIGANVGGAATNGGSVFKVNP